ncbi:alpha-galactosidase [Nakamurella sp. UYEF19]|uniref:family 4 glycosyl hydrolase n=1 Tax=Nakamurella sp. UYEF19 TaxID=1756392 RepID=UPI00339B3B38
MSEEVERRTLVLIGAGSAVFTRGLLADLISAKDLGDWDIRLVDVAPAALATAVGLATRMVAARGAERHIAVTGTTDRRKALLGADFIVTCVGVGGRPAWQADHRVCMEHGIFQPVGDSVMPGGISRLLRTTPVLVAIALDIAELAPEAFFFNYSNPMTANVMAMARYAGLPGVVGLCHGMHHVQRHLAAYLGEPLAETSTLYAGINHLTFIYDFRVRGRDAWPRVRDRVAADLAQPMDPALIGDIWNENTSAWQNPFSWELFARYGAFPAAEDRHVTEFFPERWSSGEYYGKTLGLDAFSVQEILDWGENRYQGMRAQADGSVPLDDDAFERSSGEQEQLIGIIGSVLADSREMFSCNVINNGAVPGLPDDAALEIPGVATARGIRPIAVPDLSLALTAILQRRLTPVYLSLEAAMTGDRNMVVEAILADGAVADPAPAAALADNLIATQLEYLPRFR